MALNRRGGAYEKGTLETKGGVVSTYDIFNEECRKRDRIKGGIKMILFHSFSVSRLINSIGASGLEERL